MNWSYIAGFFDGEGSLTHNGKGFRITIPQNNKPVLMNIKTFSGYGNIIYIPKRKEHWSNGWTYYIAKQDDVYKFLLKIKSFLIVKKKLVEKIIPELNEIIKQRKIKKRLYCIRKQKGKQLRQRGLTYREIGNKLKVDWGYARRLILDLD